MSHDLLASYQLRMGSGHISVETIQIFCLLIIGGVKCCIRKSNLRHCSYLKYKHHSLVIDYLDIPVNHLFSATSSSGKLV